MSLDELARAATGEVRTAAAARDLVALRGDLDRRLVQHRRRAVVLAAAVVLAVVLSGLTVVVARRHSSAAPPVAPRPTPAPTQRLDGNGPILFISGNRLSAVDPVTALPTSRLHLAGILRDPWQLAVSPDGNEVLVDVAGSLGGPVLFDTRSGLIGSTGMCSFAECEPSWSPDGRVVAVSDGRGLVLVDFATRARRVLVPIDRGLVAGPTWSPDGSRIAFVDPGGPPALVVVRASDGSQVARVPLDPRQRFYQATWSPDGSQIALLSQVGTTDADSPLVVDALAVSGDAMGRQHRLRVVGHCYCIGFAPGIAWSPDSKQIAVTAIGGAAPAGNGLNVMNADGSGLRLVAAGASGRPAWQPVPR